jgi:hypothetical protein
MEHSRLGFEPGFTSGCASQTYLARVPSIPNAEGLKRPLHIYEHIILNVSPRSARTHLHHPPSHTPGYQSCDENFRQSRIGLALRPLSYYLRWKKIRLGASRCPSLVSSVREALLRNLFDRYVEYREEEAESRWDDY